MITDSDGHLHHRSGTRIIVLPVRATRSTSYASRMDNTMNADQFQLYDLTVVVEAIEGHCTCNMTVGDRFYLRGGKLSLPEGADFCLYALQAVIPLLPAKQRRNHPADWMETDSRAVCPDPACRLIMRIDRTGLRTLRHDDVSPIPWEEAKSKPQ